MSNLAKTQTAIPLANGLQPLSCLRCARRKVRCDRVVPCSNCARHHATCEFPQPRTERRRRRRTPGCSHTKSNSLSESQHRRHTSLDPDPGSASGNHTPIPASDTANSDNSPEDQHHNVLPTGSTSRVSLTSPPILDLAHQLSSLARHFTLLWQRYLSNVHPLTMLFHGPTTGETLLSCVGSGSIAISDISTQALLSAVSACAVTSMVDADCFESLGESRSALLARCRSICENCLTRAKVFTSSDLTVHQAYTAYLISISQDTDPCELWTLTGIAKRNAKRLGYNKKVPGLDTSPFQVEMQRRLWMNIVLLDDLAAYDAELSPLDAADEICPPANINADGLPPRAMIEAENPRGPADMLFCLLRLRINTIMKAVSAGVRPWLVSTGGLTTDFTLRIERQRLIGQVEKDLELGFLRYCDMLYPVHMLAVLVARFAVCELRFVAIRLDSCDPGTTEKSGCRGQRLLAGALKLLEYQNSMRLQSIISGLVWFQNERKHMESAIHVLEALIANPTLDSSDKAWDQIDTFYSTRPELLREYGLQTSTKMKTINKTLAAWQTRKLDLQRHHKEMPEEPTYIMKLQALSSESVSPSEELAGTTSNPAPTSTPAPIPTMITPTSMSSLHNGADYGIIEPFQDQTAVMDWDTLLEYYPSTTELSHSNDVNWWQNASASLG